MTITVISQTTAERRAETKELFESIRPLLDDGYSYHSALKKIGRITGNCRFYQQAWYRDLTEYGGTQGYPYDDYKGVGFKK